MSKDVAILSPYKKYKWDPNVNVSNVSSSDTGSVVLSHELADGIKQSMYVYASGPKTVLVKSTFLFGWGGVGGLLTPLARRTSKYILDATYLALPTPSKYVLDASLLTLPTTSKF